jgi:hypothetical protein
MNDIITITETDNTASIIPARPGLDEIDFLPIEGLNLHPFQHTLLKLGQFLTKTGTRREISEAKLSRMMVRYCNQLHIRPFTAKEIREQLWGGSGEFRGGGVKVEWFETSCKYERRQAHYEFSFSQIYKPAQPAKP